MPTSPTTTNPIDERPVGTKLGGVFGRTISLGRWGGVPVSAHWTVLFTVALFAEVLATSVFPSARSGLSGPVYGLSALLTSAVFLLTLLVHELAHAITARHFGMRVRGITLWMLGGRTELDDESPTPRGEALVALAGPATSIWLGAVAGLLAGWVGTSSLVGAALSWLAAINILMGLFNMLPGAPLDGGRLLRSLLWWRWADRTRADVVTARAGRMLGYVLVCVGFLEVLTGSAVGLWLVLLGWFIINGASTDPAVNQIGRLAGVRADDAMTSPAPVADWWTVDQYLSQQAGQRDAAAPVLPTMNFAGEATGAITRREIERVPRESRSETRIRDLIRVQRMQALVVPRETSLADIAGRLRLHGGVAVVIDDDKHPLGVITTADLTPMARAVGRTAASR